MEKHKNKVWKKKLKNAHAFKGGQKGIVLKLR